MLNTIFMVIIGYIVIKLFWKIILPVIKLLGIILLSFFAIKNESFIGYIFLFTILIYYINRMIVIVKNIKKVNNEYVVKY